MLYELIRYVDMREDYASAVTRIAILYTRHTRVAASDIACHYCRRLISAATPLLPPAPLRRFRRRC